MTIEKLVELLAKLPDQDVDISLSYFDSGEGDRLEREIGGMDVKLDAEGHVWRVVIVSGSEVSDA